MVGPGNKVMSDEEASLGSLEMVPVLLGAILEDWCTQPGRQLEAEARSAHGVVPTPIQPSRFSSDHTGPSGP